MSSTPAEAPSRFTETAERRIILRNFIQRRVPSHELLNYMRGYFYTEKDPKHPELPPKKVYPYKDLKEETFKADLRALKKEDIVWASQQLKDDFAPNLRMLYGDFDYASRELIRIISNDTIEAADRIAAIHLYLKVGVARYQSAAEGYHVLLKRLPELQQLIDQAEKGEIEVEPKIIEVAKKTENRPDKAD